MKSCPFCGGRARMRFACDEYWAECAGCGAAVGTKARGEDAAWALWNRRGRAGTKATTEGTEDTEGEVAE